MTPSSYRKLWTWLAGAVLIILVLLLAFRIYGYFRLQQSADRFQSEIGPLSPGAEFYTPPRVLETRNAGIVLLGGAYSTVMTAEERGFLRQLTHKPYRQWDEGSVARAREIVQRNEAAYQVMARAIPLKQSSFNLKYEMGVEMPIPNFLNFIQAISLLSIRARLHLMDGDVEEGFRTMAVQERMAAALLHEPLLISCLIGEVAQKDYDALVQEMLYVSDAGKLQVIEQQLKHLRSMAVPLNRILAADGVALYSKLQERFGSDISETLLPRIFYRINRRLFLSYVLDGHAALVRNSVRPYAEQPESKSSGSPMLRLFGESLQPGDMYEAIGRIQAANSEMILAELAVKAGLAGKQNGAYPRDLSGFSAAPSPYTGEAPHYAVAQDGSAVVSYPEADALWDRTIKKSLVRKPLFVWKLPAIQP